MRVRATQAGFYANVYIEPGTVFDLLMNRDGSMPVREDWVPERAKDPATGQMVETGNGDYVVFKDENGDPVHRDLALDMGDQMMRRGPKRGEVVRLGWMEIVSDETPLTKLFMPGYEEPTELNLEEFQYGFDAKTRRMRTQPPKVAAPKPVVKNTGTAANPKTAKKAEAA